MRSVAVKIATFTRGGEDDDSPDRETIQFPGDLRWKPILFAPTTDKWLSLDLEEEINSKVDYPFVPATSALVAGGTTEAVYQTKCGDPRAKHLAENELTMFVDVCGEEYSSRQLQSNNVYPN
ncbi:hypothetical protein YC2023_091888 [Brassica napus]